jgi:GxxExxY protein
MDIEARLQESLARTTTNKPRQACWDGLIHAELSYAVTGAAIEVHRHLGPGQLEAVYQRALAQELAERAIPFRAQAPIATLYKGVAIGEFYADFIVDDKIIVELKAVDHLHPVHKAQVLAYLGATGLRLGLLINFNVPVLVRGVKRLLR